MTRESDFKRLVRARMRRTGESYTTARARLRRRGLPPPTPPQGGTGMYPFDRFTERAKKVLTLAHEEAEKTGGGYIGTEHLLLALLVEGDGLGARSLAALGVTEEVVRARLEQVKDRPTRAPEAAEAAVTPTARVRKVVELAFATAQEVGHRHVGTEHLLIGLVTEGEGIGARVLRELGAGEEVVRATVERLLAEAGEGPASRGRRQPPPDGELMAMFEAAGELAALEGAEQMRADHLLLAMAEPGTAVAAAADDGTSRTAATLLPGVRAIRQARRQGQEAVERGDNEAAGRHRAEERRLRDELLPALRGWLDTRR